MQDFVGSKVALFCEEKLVVLLRDDKPNISNPNMWDFFGGGREGTESPEECAIREIEEETGIYLSSESFIWKQAHESVNEPGHTAYFFVAHLTSEQVDTIVLTEGQRWEAMEVKEFLAKEDAIQGMKTRLRDYLRTQ
jgi:8-oxo-dGTP diphosphatase